MYNQMDDSIRSLLNRCYGSVQDMMGPIEAEREFFTLLEKKVGNDDAVAYYKWLATRDERDTTTKVFNALGATITIDSEDVLRIVF